ncbi:MAG: hypothetical protein ACTS6P_00930 [Candidatus Hodgkinia cicadicola]
MSMSAPTSVANLTIPFDQFPLRATLPSLQCRRLYLLSQVSGHIVQFSPNQSLMIPFGLLRQLP